MKNIHLRLKRKLDYIEYDFMHTSKQSKNPIIIFNYCKHGDLHTSSKVFLYPDKRNLCPKCAQELSILNVPINRDDYKYAIDLLKDPKKKLQKDMLFLWYPQLYGAINRLPGDRWYQKLYMFLHNMNENPMCSCGNIINFNVHNNCFHKKCENCTRSKAVTLSTTKRSIDMWTNIFINDFNIKNPKFIVKDLYNIELFLNDEKITLRKAVIHQLRKKGVLSYELIDESNFDIDYHLNEYKNNFDTYKMLSEKSLKKLIRLFIKC